MVRAIWRVFEEASSEERETMVAYHWMFQSRTDESGIELHWTRGWTRSQVMQDVSKILAKTDNTEFYSLEVLERRFTLIKVIVPNREWRKIRNSFQGSREWREFRLKWLAGHPVCARCDQTESSLCVHHVGQNALRLTVLKEGFLEGLRHPERFETVCQDCHYMEHALLIMGEEILSQDVPEEK